MGNTICEYYSNVTAKPVDWLWYPYIPYGKLTVIQGDPGEGKSTFVLNLVSLLTNGQKMPDGYRLPGPGVAIYQCAEDGMADTIKPRLMKAGANCDRVAYIIDDDIALTLEDGRIEAAIEETGATVFIIDPLQAFIPPDADMQSATKMRSVMRKLASTAEKHHCAVILIGHMNKGNGAKNLYRGLGSIDIAAIARSVLMISRDESRPGIRYMYPIKSSLAPEGAAIAFSFSDSGRIEWHGRYELNTTALIDSVTVKTTKREKARAKMIQLLEQGDKPAKEVYAGLPKKDRERAELDDSDSNVRYIPYKEQSDIRISDDNIFHVAYPEKWGGHRIGISYGLREQRNKLFSGMTEYDLGIEGTAVQNPLIGYIPDRYEVEDELEQLLLMM